MDKYRSAYPTLRQAKTKWSKPSIIAKQGEGPSHGWYDMMRKDAREKLAASISKSKMGSMSHQTKIVREEAEDEHLYHVTHTKHVGKIQKQGLRPMQTSNWVKAGNKERYGSGEVYTFTHKDDAHQWAGRMDWAHHQKLGSGNISIITVKKPKDHKFEVDTNDPLSQAGQKGKWLKTNTPIGAHHIVGVEKYAPKKLGEDVVPFTKKGDLPVLPTTYVSDPEHIKQAKGEIWNKNYSAWKERKKAERMKTEATDKIGKPTPSAEEIAKKHGISLDQVNAQLDKGVKVEREHTNSDAEAREIARDHVHEFPDYYDRLDKMETKAKKDMNEDASQWNQDREQLRNRLEAHRALEQHMTKHHGAQSQQAAFHRYHADRIQKEINGMDEEAVPNSVGGGNIAGMPTHDTPDTSVARPLGMARRKRFAGKQVFVVDPTTYHKAYLGKRKYEHYERYLEGCDIADEIRAYGRKYWDEPIIIENEQTGAMVYLKYGSK